MKRFFGLLLSALLGVIPVSAKPNILLILSDDQAWGDYGFMGHPQIETPALDRLAGESVLYTRGYSPVPLCRPSLASLTTGLYPHQHGVTGNDPELPAKGVNAMAGRKNPEMEKYYTDIIADWREHPDLLESLRAAGYVSLQTGKWWEGNPVADGGFTAGMTHSDAKRGGRHGDEGLKIGREGLQPIKEFIDGAGDKPWFVWYGVFLPHSPHTPPDFLLEKYRKLTPSEPVARYWACVEWLDRTVNELMGFLDEKGQRENTIVLYTCDNGYIQDPDKANRFAPRSKLTIYEGGIRTPIMVSWKGKLAPLRDDEHLASNIDLWPTVAKLAGIAAPADLPGIDLCDRQAVAARKRIFAESFSHNIVKLGEPGRGLQHRCVIEGDWKLVVPNPLTLPEDGTELYNLKADPWEKKNLAADEPEQVAALRKELDAWWTPR